MQIIFDTQLKTDPVNRHLPISMSVERTKAHTYLRPHRNNRHLENQWEPKRDHVVR